MFQHEASGWSNSSNHDLQTTQMDVLLEDLLPDRDQAYSQPLESLWGDMATADASINGAPGSLDWIQVQAARSTASAATRGRGHWHYQCRQPGRTFLFWGPSHCCLSHAPAVYLTDHKAAECGWRRPPLLSWADRYPRSLTDLSQNSASLFISNILFVWAFLPWFSALLYSNISQQGGRVNLCKIHPPDICHK